MFKSILLIASLIAVASAFIDQIVPLGDDGMLNRNGFDKCPQTFYKNKPVTCNSSAQRQVCHHTNTDDSEILAICFDTEWKIAMYAAHFYTPEKAKAATEAKGWRTKFRYDKSEGMTREDQSACDGKPPNNIYGRDDHFSRGHLVPAKDMAYEAGNGGAAWVTFWITNTSPQVQTFNAGRWKTLEEKSRLYTITSAKGVHHVSGVHNSEQYIKDSTVGYPDIFYKALCDPAVPRSIAYWSENKENKDGSDHYLSVKDLESKLGIKIFDPSCATDKFNPADWGFN